MSKKILPLTLFPKKLTDFLYLLLCIIAVPAGIALALQEKNWFYLICSVATFLLIPYYFLKRLFSNDTYLKITEVELSFVIMSRAVNVPMNVIDRFFVVSARIGGFPCTTVGFSFIPPFDSSQLEQQSPFSDPECDFLLGETYGMKAEAMAELLNKCLAESRSIKASKPLAVEDIDRLLSKI